MPSHREKKRYLLVRSGESSVDNIKEFRKQINQAVADFLGVLGMAKASLKFIDSGSNKKGMWAIICVSRDMLEKVRAAFCVFSDKKGKGIEVENVSGTLKKLRGQSGKKSN